MKVFDIRWFKIGCYAIATIVVAYLVAAILTTLLLCHPISYSWDEFGKKDHCGNYTDVTLASACPNLILDLALVIIPIPVILKLQMPTKKKIAFTGIFGIGVASVVSLSSVSLFPFLAI